MPTSCLIFLLIAACLSLLQVGQSFPSRMRRDNDDDDKYSSKELKTEDNPKKDEIEEVLFEGDIILSYEQKVANAMVDPEVSSVHKRSASSTIVNGKEVLNLWPNGTVPYEFASQIGAMERKYFETAMKIIQNGTCIKFISKQDIHTDFLVLDYGSEGCKSNVGHHGGSQHVTLSSKCLSAGYALHELGHAIGLWHEHSRPDRDTYIEFIKENLEFEQDEIHFQKTSQALFKTVPDVGYDIQSIMHYNEFAYARSGNGIDVPTIRIKEDSGLEELECTNRLQMGQREQLSYKDRLRIKELYGCSNVVEEPECIKPTPTPTITTASEDDISSTPMPDPSQTVATQAPRLKPRLKNGNILTLNLIDTKTINGKEETVYDDRGMECTPSPGCVPQECVGFTGCSGISNQFQIVKRDDSDTRNPIRGGNTVLLRSISDYSLWLDCSEPSQCTISECSEDNEEDTRNASYVSSCDKHRFKIFGVNRGNRILNVNTTLKFKHIDKDAYLKCDSRACGTNVSVCPLSSTTSCPTDIFKATKEAE